MDQAENLPALSAIACDPAPALTLLSGSSTPEKTLRASAEDRGASVLVKVDTYLDNELRSLCGVANINEKSSSIKM